MNSRGDCPSCGEWYAINPHFGGRCNRCGHDEDPVIIPRVTSRPTDVPKPEPVVRETVTHYWKDLPRIEGPWKLGS